MALFTNHKLQLVELFKVIPQELFSSLSKATKVDYYCKVLTGKLLFYLLLYLLLVKDRLGQRGIADLYSSLHFRVLFPLDFVKKNLSHSSISERLAKVEITYFQRLYEEIYHRFAALYPAKTIAGLKLQRVDSTLVVEASNKLVAGLCCGNQYKKRKTLKYTITYDGMFGCFAQTHTQDEYANESLALPENVLGHFKKSEDHAQVYLFDRGQASTNKFVEMKSQEGLLFVGRLQEKRNWKIVKEFDLNFKHFEDGTLKMDALIQLYKIENRLSKTGKKQRKVILEETVFRIIRFCPYNKDEDIILITNILHLPAQTIASMYRRRWDIEVFFRFIKQEVNFSHFISLNENGIQVMLYMTLIAAMVIMIYKKENAIGFKTAKRRMEMELQELIISIVVKLTGGDLSKLNYLNVNLPDP
jgi:hypothetical protein